jgi:uncharacterized protein YecE (DUF72 family)
MIIGMSGWQYASWRGRFYPRDIPQRSWLEHYAARFACVEVNNTHGDTALRSWVRRTSELWDRGEDVHVFFNNDGRGCAVRDAVRFAGHARRAGWATRRVPSLAEAVVR